MERGKEKNNAPAGNHRRLKAPEQSAIRAPGLAAPSPRIGRVNGGGASGQKPLRETVTWRSLAVLPEKELGTKHHLP